MYKSGRIPLTPAFTEGGEVAGNYTISTDEFVVETETVYMVESEPLRLVGHPYGHTNPTSIPFISPSRFTVFELDLPDYNKFHLPERAGAISLESEVFVWKVVGVRVDSQGIITPAVTGQTYSSKVASDNGPPAAAPTADYDAEDTAFKPFYWGMEHKQRQLLAVGCQPMDGVTEMYIHNTAANGTVSFAGLERTVKPVEDGMLCEFGFGNKDFNHDTMQYDPTSVPMEMLKHSTWLPDMMGMAADEVGDKCFFHIERDCCGIRHTGMVRGMISGEEGANLGAGGENENWYKEAYKHPDQLRSITAGMVSAQNDIMNKNYWLNKARGPNNGICWGNKLYVTAVDNIRGYVHRATTQTTNEGDETYDPTKIKYYLRHVKEFKLHVIVRLCKVKLEARLVTMLMRLNSQWLANFGFHFNMPEKDTHTGVFKVPGEEEMHVEVESPSLIETIKIDCNGKMSCPFKSHSHLAREYQTNNPTGAAPKKAASKKK